MPALLEPLGPSRAWGRAAEARSTQLRTAVFGPMWHSCAACERCSGICSSKRGAALFFKSDSVERVAEEQNSVEQRERKRFMRATAKTLSVGFVLICGQGCSEAIEVGESDLVSVCYRGTLRYGETRGDQIFVEGDLEVTEYERWCDDLSEVKTQGRRAPSPPGTVWGTDVYGVNWTNGVVPYQIDLAFNPGENQAILNAMNEWSQVAPGVSFRPKKSGDASWVRFEKDTQCSSGYGMIPGERTIRLTSGCTTNYSLHHEIGHALGLQHEHTRSDRDDYVVVKDGSGANFAIDSGADLFEYDFDSVMHYPFSSSMSLASGVEVPPGVTVGQRTHLSSKDVASVRAMYPVLRMRRSVFVAPGGTADLCYLEGRERDAATKFRVRPPGAGGTFEFGGNSVLFAEDVGVTRITRECGARSQFWIRNYNYPNSDESQFGSGTGHESFGVEGDVVLLTAGLVPVLL